LTPGGLWDSNNYEIKALVKYRGKIIKTLPLAFAGPSMFNGLVKVSEKGDYEIIVYAYDRVTGNTGVDKLQVEVN
jgi:hypothetical protein